MAQTQKGAKSAEQEIDFGSIFANAENVKKVEHFDGDICKLINSSVDYGRVTFTVPETWTDETRKSFIDAFMGQIEQNELIGKKAKKSRDMLVKAVKDNKLDDFFGFQPPKPQSRSGLWTFKLLCDVNDTMFMKKLVESCVTAHDDDFKGRVYDSIEKKIGLTFTDVDSDEVDKPLDIGSKGLCGLFLVSDIHSHAIQGNNPNSKKDLKVKFLYNLAGIPEGKRMSTQYSFGKGEPKRKLIRPEWFDPTGSRRGFELRPNFSKELVMVAFDFLGFVQEGKNKKGEELWNTKWGWKMYSFRCSSNRDETTKKVTSKYVTKAEQKGISVCTFSDLLCNLLGEDGNVLRNETAIDLLASRLFDVLVCIDEKDFDSAEANSVLYDWTPKPPAPGSIAEQLAAKQQEDIVEDEVEDGSDDEEVVEESGNETPMSDEDSAEEEVSDEE